MRPVLAAAFLGWPSSLLVAALPAALLALVIRRRRLSLPASDRLAPSPGTWQVLTRRRVPGPYTGTELLVLERGIEIMAIACVAGCLFLLAL